MLSISLLCPPSTQFVSWPINGEIKIKIDIKVLNTKFMIKEIYKMYKYTTLANTKITTDSFEKLK